MSGVSVDRAGLNIAHDGTGGSLDEGYDATANAFYFGKVSFDPVGIGTTELHLTVGSGGVARTGDQPQPDGPTVSLLFGHGEPSVVLGDEFGATGTIADATIHVIPEPVITSLLWSGLLLGLLLRRVRSQGSSIGA